MCLIVRRAKHEEPLKPSVAKRDIVCYKVMKNVYRGASFVTRGRIHTYLFDFKWSRNGG